VRETQKESALVKFVEAKRLIDIYYDIQDVRIRTANRLRAMPQETVGIYPKSLIDLEKQLKSQADTLLQNEPIYVWMNKIKGIGPCLAGGLIASINIAFVPIENLDKVDEIQKEYSMKTKDKKFLVPTVRGIQAFDRISNLWSYCGQSVVDGHAPKRKRGEKINWSTKLRVLCWKLGESFVKTGDFYREIYEKFREVEDQRDYICNACKKKYPKAKQCSKGHRYARAKRKTVKLFLSHLWLKWRTLEGLPVSEPYIIGKDVHSNFILYPT